MAVAPIVHSTKEMELDESNPPIDDLKWAYGVAGENPGAWQASAKDLLDGAMAVKDKVYPFSNAMHSLARVEAMLLGMALECLLKGIYIRRHRVWADPAKEYALVKDGKYVGVKGAGDHDLVQLAKAAAVTLSQSERSILTRLTDFIYAGRYPVPSHVEEMKPVKIPGGSTVARAYLSGRRNREGRDPYQPPHERNYFLKALRIIRRGTVVTARSPPGSPRLRQFRRAATQQAGNLSGANGLRIQRHSGKAGVGR